MKKLVVGGWLTVAGMTLFDVFRKREDGESIWSDSMQIVEDNVPLNKVEKKIIKAFALALMIIGAPAFAGLYAIKLIMTIMAAVN